MAYEHFEENLNNEAASATGELKLSPRLPHRSPSPGGEGRGEGERSTQVFCCLRGSMTNLVRRGGHPSCEIASQAMNAARVWAGLARATNGGLGKVLYLTGQAKFTCPE